MSPDRHRSLPRPAWKDQGQGPPLVLVHGFGAHGACWEPWLPELERHHRVLNVDLGGFGRAPAPPGAAYGPEAQARALLGWMDELELQDVTLVGHSMGGGIALLVALHLQERGEDRLAGLVAVAGAAYHVRPEPPFVRMARHPRLARLGLELAPRRWLIRTVMKGIVAQKDAVTDERVARYAAPLRRAGTRRALISCARTIIPPELDRLTARYPELDVPTLCLWGRQDPVIPLSYGEKLAGALPDATLAVLEGCGHLVVEECPRASLDALLAFLERRVWPRVKAPAPPPPAPGRPPTR